MSTHFCFGNIATAASLQSVSNPTATPQVYLPGTQASAANDQTLLAAAYLLIQSHLESETLASIESMKPVQCFPPCVSAVSSLVTETTHAHTLSPGSPNSAIYPPSPSSTASVSTLDDDGIIPTAPQLKQLCVQQEGSELVRQLWAYSNPQGKRVLASRLSTALLKLSLDDFGCKVMQTVTESSDTALLGVFCGALERLDASALKKLAEDKNGNHVLQRILSGPSTASQCYVIVKALCANGVVVEMARHRYACRIVQKLLLKPNMSVDCKAPVLEALTSVPCHVLCGLATNQFGNYAVQGCLELGRPVDRSRIIQALVTKIVDPQSNIMCDKFASNVLEKALSHALPQERELVLAALLLTPDVAARAMKDQYGNYVIQKCLGLDPSLLGVQSLKSLVLANATELKRSKYGWHLVNRARNVEGTRL